MSITRRRGGGGGGGLGLDIGDISFRIVAIVLLVRDISSFIMGAGSLVVCSPSLLLVK